MHGTGIKNTYVQLVQSLSLRDYTPPLFHIPSQRGAQLPYLSFLQR